MRYKLSDLCMQELNPIMSCFFPFTPPPNNLYIEDQALLSNRQHCQAFKTTTSYTTDPYNCSTQWTYSESDINIMDKDFTNKGGSTYAFDMAYFY